MVKGKKLLILYTSHTLGHKSIAENIGYYLSQAGYEVILRDAMDIERSNQVRGFLKLHILVYRYAPWLWRWLYMWGYVLTLPLWKITARLHSKKIEAVVVQENPDMIIATQVSPSAVVSFLKRKGSYQGLFGIAFSDFHFHPAWAYPEADFYLVNIVEQKQALIRRGVSPAAIFICGVTAKPKSKVIASEVKQKFGIPELSKVVLLSSGSLGIGLSSHIVDILQHDVHVAFREKGLELHTIIVCGRNEQLRAELVQKVSDKNIHVTGFYTPMDELYAIANLYISKPGGLSVIESLRWGVPMFVTHMLPGQEELNLRHLSRKQLVVPLFVKPRAHWARELFAELDGGSFRASLVNNAYGLELVEESAGQAVVQGVESMFHGKKL